MGRIHLAVAQSLDYPTPFESRARKGKGAMETRLQVLSEEERARVHEESLDILQHTGVRVETPLGRQALENAGASVDETNELVRFPKELVEQSLELAPKDFSLGARRPGADLRMNGGNSTLCLDGSGTMALDRDTGERRPATYDDWRSITRIADALDEIGIYWAQVSPSDAGDTLLDEVDYMCSVHRNFSKHVQDTIGSPESAPWATEVLQVIFGSVDDIREKHPMSYVLCPTSPLMIDREYTETYLALRGLKIPATVMPMPLMGATAPASMISTIVQGNCEVLSMLCLLQAHEPGVPVIYAPVLAVMDPRSGRLRSASMETTMMAAAATEMARYYGLPAQSSPGGSDAHILDVQCAYESSAMALPAALSWPDIVVGPGLLDGSMVSCLESLLIDVEVFRFARQSHRGVVTDEESWLTDAIAEVGPCGHYLSQPSTRTAVHSGEWFLSDLGVHDSYESWKASRTGDFPEEVRERVDQVLATHEPLPLDDEVEKELDRIRERAERES
jgi:trimethylamine--corrinoid protein Co-methyltransferase